MARICVVMAIYQPNPEFLSQQLASIANQTHTQHDLLCVIADKVSGPLVQSAARDAGLNVRMIEPDAPADAVRAFELGLDHALTEFPDTEFFALADQDDVWAPQKLSTGLQRLLRDQTDLVHSDATLIDERGQTIAPSLFCHDKRPADDTPRSLLYRNTVTGMTTLCRRDVVQRALPFPAQDGLHFYHDLWLGLIAATGRGISRLNDPMVAYRQHGANAVGAKGAEPPKTLRQAAASFALARYLAVSARQRDGDASALRPFWKPWQIPQFINDAVPLGLSGQTAAARQAACFAAISMARPVWAAGQLLARLGPTALRAELNRLDQKLYSLSPGQQPDLTPATQPEPEPAANAEPWWVHFDPRTKLKWDPAFTAPHPAINVLVPSLNPSEIFAGIATALDLGIALARHGHLVRFIATDLPVAAPGASLAFILSRARSPELRARMSLCCGVTSATVPTHPDDQFIATAWWTAHVANTLTDDPRMNASAFYYLIQDYEPLFYPWGTEHAGALASYDLPARPIFNTRLLAEHSEAQGHRFAYDPLIFAPSIPVADYARLPRRSQEKPRLVLYGRPEVPRNLFPLAIESLGRFIEAEHLTQADLEVVSLGLKHRNVLLPGGVEVQSEGKLPWSDYPAFLAGSAVGLSLMMSPHPSHPPIEMAAAGMRVVTNTFGPKDLGTLAPQIVSADLTVPALSAALSRAWHMPEPGFDQRNISIADLGGPLDAVADAIHLQISGHIHQCAA